MADYTITTSETEEAAVTFARLAANKTGLQQFADNAAFVAFYAHSTLLSPLISKFIEARVQVVADKYRTADAKDRATVDATLKVDG